MAYKISVTAPAYADLIEAADIIAADSPSAARDWVRKWWLAIDGLTDMPKRFAVIEESEEFDQEYRDFTHYSHRVIYLVDEATSTVVIVRVYHMARRPLRIEDLP